MADRSASPDRDGRDGGAGFELLGGEIPASPVIVSVPHAGRHYPAELLAALRLPVTALTLLEDRHVDAVARAARGRETVLIQRTGRAWIDLNRGEDERDPAIDDGAAWRAPADRSAKLRAGLGLVPRRAGRLGDLWHGRFSAAEVERRIVGDHRPYHAALARVLAAARARFGVAVLLDLHSMPPLGAGRGQVVLGDRFGRSAASRLVARAEAAIGPTRWRVALNNPYAGGHVLARHGRPGDGIHAIQVELDRSLYLDARLDQPGAGLPAAAAAIGRLAEALADEASSGAAADRLAAQ